MYPGIALVLVSLIVVCGGFERDLTIIIDPARRDCFFQQAKEGQTIDVEYQVIDGGQGALDIDFTLNGPTGLILSSPGRRRAGAHRGLAPDTGIYRFCFDNTHSAFNAKTVYFDLLIELDDDEDDHDSIETQNESVQVEDPSDWHSRLISVSSRVSKALGGARRLQEASVASATRDAKLAERSLSRVTLCGFGQAAAMLVVGLLQVIMVKSLFDDKSKIHCIMKRLTAGHS